MALLKKGERLIISKEVGGQIWSDVWFVVSKECEFCHKSSEGASTASEWRALKIARANDSQHYRQEHLFPARPQRSRLSL